MSMSDRIEASHSETDIASYLLENPDFFDRHPEVLRDLRLHHATGPAVSLIEKQVSALRERNTELRHRLSQLLDNARENDGLFERSKRLVLALLECNELGDLVDALYYSFDKEFNIPCTRLILFNQELDNSNARITTLDDARRVLGPHMKARRAISGGLNNEQMQFLFDRDADNVGSAAFAVLIYNEPLGLLAIGHQDPQHYQSGMDTLFLTHIGEVLDRLLPRYLP